MRHFSGVAPALRAIMQGGEWYTLAALITAVRHLVRPEIAMRYATRTRTHKHILSYGDLIGIGIQRAVVASLVGTLKAEVRTTTGKWSCNLDNEYRLTVKHD